MKNNELTLKGKGFILRPYRKEDYVSLAENANNKKIAKNMLDEFPSPYTEKDAKEWIIKKLKVQKKGFYNDLVIDIDGKAVGTIAGGTYMKPFIFGLGYWLGEKYWGQGIMSEAIKIYTKFIFKYSKDTVKIVATTFPWNKSSQRALLKNGFKLEGILRKSYMKNGKILDEYMFGKLRNGK